MSVCIHCHRNPPLPTGSPYCRLCALSGRFHQQEVAQRPWWEAGAYKGLDWKPYLVALVAELEDNESSIALPCRRAARAALPPAAIRILTDDIGISR